MGALESSVNMLMVEIWKCLQGWILRAAREADKGVFGEFNMGDNDWTFFLFFFFIYYTKCFNVKSIFHPFIGSSETDNVHAITGTHDHVYYYYFSSVASHG